MLNRSFQACEEGLSINERVFLGLVIALFWTGVMLLVMYVLLLKIMVPWLGAEKGGGIFMFIIFPFVLVLSAAAVRLLAVRFLCPWYRKRREL
jgi:hypothetical protein